MPKAKRTIKPVTPATSKPVSSKPATPRVIAIAKPAKPVKPETVAAPAPATTAAATMPRGLTRDAAGVVRNLYPFGAERDHDAEYLAFFGAVCRANNGSATLRQIHDAGTPVDGAPRKRVNPLYTGDASAKATNVGYIARLVKAGYFIRSADGNTLTATDKAKSSAAYRGTAKS